MARSARTRSTGSLEQLLAAKEIVICCGSGGVGKTTTAARSTTVSSARRSASSIVSWTGISSGAETMTTPVCSGSPRMSIIHPVWSRTRPTWTSSLIACGAASCPTMWPLAEASTTTRS